MQTVTIAVSCTQLWWDSPRCEEQGCRHCGPCIILHARAAIDIASKYIVGSMHIITEFMQSSQPENNGGGAAVRPAMGRYALHRCSIQVNASQRSSNNWDNVSSQAIRLQQQQRFSEHTIAEPSRIP